MYTPLTGRFVVPETVATHFHLKEGDTVADFGAGSGYFLSVLSRGVGADGRVYACEIQRELVDKLTDVARTQNLDNVDPIWCDLEEAGGVKIADDSLDAAIVVNTFFQLEDKAAAAREFARALRPGGMLYLIDWSESFGGLGPQPGDVVSASEATELMEANGFSFERSFDAGDHHYGHSYRVV